MKIIFFAPDAVRPNGEGAYAHCNLRSTCMQLGHTIVDYDFRAAQKTGGPDKVMEELKALVEEERPDLFFHMHCTDELPEAMTEHLRRKTDVTSVVFFSDDDWRLQESLKLAGRYDVVITTRQEAVADYHRHGVHHVVCAPYACNPQLYYPIPDLPKRYDVSFVGQAYRGRLEIIQWLKAQGVNIRLWGGGWEALPDLRDCAGGWLPHRAMLDVFSASRIMLGLSWVSGDGTTLQIKGRTFEYAACRAFQLTTYDARLTQYFKENEEIIFYRDREDLLKQIQFYLAHESERERIAQACYERVLTDHTWAHRLQRLFADIALQRRARKKVSHGSVPARTEPLVSVLTYVYNGERYIEELIQSVLAQTYKNFEFLILDDGSTDGTKAIVQRYLSDSRVRYVYQHNIGRKLDAFHELINRSVALTTGELICFAGADDVYLPEKLQVQVDAFREDPDLDIAFSDGFHINAEGRQLQSDFRFAESRVFTRRSLARTLFKKNIIPHPTVMMKRTAVSEMGGFEDGYTTDPQFWLKASPHLRFHYTDRKLIKYRIHEGGSSTSSTNRTVPETVGLLTRMRPRFTISELYPELASCADRPHALYSAYLHFGLLLAMANIPAPELAIAEWQRALEHRPDGIEAVNNIAVLLALLGRPDKAEQWLRTRHVRFDRVPAAQETRSLVMQLARGAKTLSTGFTLLSEHPDDSELLARLDPPAQLELNRQYYGPLVVSIQPVKRIAASTVTETSPSLGKEQAKTASRHEQDRANAHTSGRPGAPMVSVIIPTYNRPQQLMEAVRSVLAQTFQDLEIIVVNDAGGALEQVLAAEHSRRPITYIRHGQNLERSAARNSGLRVARGKYIAYLDDDDRFLPNHLETLVGFLETHDYRVAYSDAWRVTQVKVGDHYEEVSRDVPYSNDFNANQLLITNYLPILTVLHERACLDEVGYFDEALASHEDWDLWIRLSRRFRFAHVKQTTCEFTWRMDGSSTTSRNRADFLRTAEIIYDRYRAMSESIPGVCELQAQSLQALREATEVKDRKCVCSIIIPVWNKVELTQQCLTALAEVTEGIEYEVIVVDNGSTDGTQAFLSRLSGDIRVIRNGENLGFAKACNQGAKAARSEFLVFLNNDTIPLKGWLTPLVEEVRTHPDVAVVGSKLLYEDGTIQHAGVAFSREWYVPYHIYAGRDANLPGVCRRREFKSVTAACMLVRREVFFSVGGFDEGYRNGFEDVDLCLQIGQQHWKIIYQPKSVLYHLESRTPGRKAYEKENSRRLLERWGHCWWLPDEDWIHFEDGYAFHTVVTDDKLGYRLQPMTDAQMRSQRAVVTEAQRAAHRQDRDAVMACLKRPDEWPADVWILRWAALLCVALRCTELSCAFWRRVLLLEEDDRGRVVLAKAAIGTGDAAEAERQVGILLANYPEHGEGWLLRGVMAMQRQAYAEAGQAFAAARRYGADERKAALGVVMASVGEQRFEVAWETVWPLCESIPDDEECLHWLLRCGTPLERWAQLETRLKTFVARNPANLAMRFARAGVLLRLGRVADARAEYGRLQLLDPDLEGLEDLGKQLKEAEQGAVIGHVA